LLLTCAAYYRSIIKGPSYKVLADAQYEYKVKSGDMNYEITDCNGNDMMNYKKKYYVDIVFPDFLLNDIYSDEFVTLDLILKNYNSNYNIVKLMNDKKAVPTSMEIDENAFQKILKFKSLKGVYTYSFNAVDLNKAWTIENMIFSGIKNSGNENNSEVSVEKKLYGIVKLNKSDQKVFSKDINRNVVIESESLNKNNINIKLTIDKSLQQNIKTIISGDNFKGFAQIGVVLMDDQGRIKALTQKEESLPNINTSVMLYPGSIFKTIVEEAALENNKISPEDKFLCRGINEGEDHRLHGSLNVSQAFSVSCNDIFSQIGNKTGEDAIVECASSQGMLDKVLDLKLEEKGLFDKKPELSDGSLGLTAIGQNMRITPIEALSISSTVINQGRFVKPIIIEKIIKGGKAEPFSNPSTTTVLNERTADIMKNEMLDVVKNGTAKAAYTDKIQIGGKTGTTERRGDAPGDIRKNTMHSDGWFVGFFKVHESYYSMVVCVQDIDLKTQSGGNTAAEIFKQIALKCRDSIK
jgi:cell division protein FtsI/penicillin-binding protein 2